jgi:hypothetical protein
MSARETGRGQGPGERRSDATIEEFVDALMLFDEPMLNSRYHGLLLRMSDGEVRDRLAELPGLVLESTRLARRGALEWTLTRQALQDDFKKTAERFLLQAFLALAEEQLRHIAFMARSAPTREARQHFDEMSDVHRRIAATLRGVLGANPHPSERPPRGLRGAQEEEAAGDIRGQIESTIRSFEAIGRRPRTVILSPVGLRHLRDQGLFQDGDSTVLGVSASVDFAWDAPAFAVLTFDLVPLEEILHGGDE